MAPVFDFESKTVLLNSGYAMPLNGLGTYSLHGDTCVASVRAALESGVRLIDTASAYGNEAEVGRAVREAIDAGVVPFIQGKGIAVEAWYPLGERPHAQKTLADPVIVEIAQAHGVSAAQAVLRWELQRGVVVIPRSSNPAHIAEDAQLYGFELSSDEMERMNALDRNEKHDWY